MHRSTLVAAVSSVNAASIRWCHSLLSVHRLSSRRVEYRLWIIAPDPISTLAGSARTMSLTPALFRLKRALSGVPTTDGNVTRLFPETALTAEYPTSSPMFIAYPSRHSHRSGIRLGCVIVNPQGPLPGAAVISTSHSNISANSVTAAVKSHCFHFIQKSITDPPPQPEKQCQ